MKFKNKIMFICLIMLILLGMAAVSAAQDIDNNSTLQTGDLDVEEVISSQNTDDLEAQPTEVGLENDIEDVLEADGSDAVGNQVENDEIENGMNDLAVANGDLLGSSAEELVGDDSDWGYVFGFKVYNPDYNAARPYMPDLGSTFDKATYLQNWHQYKTYSPYVFLYGDGYAQMNLYSTGEPILLKGGGGTFYESFLKSSSFYDVYLLGNVDGGTHGTLDARGLSSIAKIYRKQTLAYFQNLDLINAVNGAVIIEDFDNEYMEKYNKTPEVVFEDCNFRNISGGVVIANDKCSILFKNCNFEDISSDFGAVKAVEGTSITFENCKFTNIQYKAHVELVNSANGVLTGKLISDYPLYIGAVLSNGSVVFTNCEFWNGREFVKTNEENIRDNTLRNKPVHMEVKFEDPSSYPVGLDFVTDDDSQFKFDYRNTADFLNAGGEGYNTFNLTFEGDNYVLPFNATGAFDTHGGFNYLQSLVNNASENSTINLTRDIIYSEVYDSIVNGIVISKNNLTIDGKGHTIDAKGFSRIFKFSNDNIRYFTLKNIILINGKTDVYGGAIEFAGHYGTIENVTFINNSAVNGGAVEFTNNNGKIINCTFDSNHADRNGGAVHFATYTIMGGATTIQGCVFTNNTAKNGGAIFNLESNSVTLAGNNFTSNKATLGGAIYNNKSSYNTIKESVFSANEATLGGAIYFEVNPMGIDSSNFTLNVAEQGGAIYLSNKNNNGDPETKEMSISNSYFKDNRANATEIVVIDDDRINQKLTVGLKGKENYINAIYAEDDVTVNFDNVSYWGDGKWEIKNNDVKSEYAPYARIDLYAVSTNSRIISRYEISDVNGHAIFEYGNESTGYYPIAGLQHNPDSYYTLAQQQIALSVKNSTFTDLQTLIDNTPEGGELILLKDFAFSDVDDAQIKANGGISINKNITITGQDHIIDAKGQTRIFNANADNVSISGIIFENGADVEGSVAQFNKGDVKVNNCILINNPGHVFSVGEGTSYDFNDNWFGSDWTDYNVKPSALGDLEVDRWYFLNITVTGSSISMSLNNEYDNSENAVIVVDDEDYELPFLDFAFNATSNIQINEDVTENISIAGYNQLTYTVPELSNAYGHPVGITLEYGEKSFTKTEIFEPNLHLEVLPDTMLYGNVTNHVKVVGAFGEVIIYDASNQLKYDRSKYVRFMLSNGKSIVLDHDGNGYYDLKLTSLLNASEPGTYNYTLYIENDMLYNRLYGNFTILPVTPALNIIVEDGYVGQPNNLTVILDSVFGGVSEGYLFVYLDGWPIIMTNATGERVYTFEIRDYLGDAVGQHVVNATYIPVNTTNPHYLRMEYAETFQVFKYGSKIDVDAPNNITYGEDFTFEVTIDNKTNATYSIRNASGEIIQNGAIDGNEFAVSGLACGDYELVITNDESDSVYSSDFIKEFTVSKINPKMEVNCSVVGPHVNITVKMDSDVTGNISFNGIVIPIENGVATYIGEFEEGYHVLDVNYITDKPDIFNPVNRSVSFYTTRLNDEELLNTSIEVIPEMANNNVFLTAKVNPSATGVVAFTIDGESVLIPIVNGEAVHYAILEAGTYTVVATYAGDSQFNANSTSITIDVTDKVKQNTAITSNVLVDGNNVEITVEVDEYATGEVEFTIDGNTYKVDVFFGKAVFNGYFKEGYHAVLIEYLGDDEFESNSTAESFTIDNDLKNTTVDVETKIDGRTVELFIRLDAETNGFALIDINGTETYVKVDYGFAYYKTELNPGNYNVDVNYLGDEKFNPAEATKEITVEQPVMKDSNLTLSVSVEADNVFVIIKVPSDATGEVLLMINDSFTFYDLTGDNTYIRYSALLPLGTYNISAIYSGDEYYDFGEVSKTVEINSTSIPSLLKTVIFAPQVTTAYNSNGYLTLTIKDENGNLVKSKDVSITINGKTKVVKTNAKGVAKLSTKGLAPKTYTASIVFKGDGTYAKSSTTAKVVVKKAASKITAKKKTFKKAKKTKKYKITLKSGKKAIKKVKVTLKIKGKTYKAKTNAKGKAVFKIKKLSKKGKFTAKIKFKGNKYYKAVSKKVKITIK